ncbi:MAG: sulfatase-like hydrolase/transferase [Maioricimonas sp. JB049]
MRRLALLFLLVLAIPAQADQHPNILLIMADDVGVECLGSYGGTSYPTPHLDRLAGTGTRFTHCYSMAVCHPTRITLMTGRYPFRFAARGGDFPNDVADTTIGPLMQQAGYATAVAGKWQIAQLRDNPQHPAQLGFDEWGLFGWHEGPRYWQPLIWQNGGIRDDVADRYGPDVYADFLIDFMQQHRDGPFFAYFPMALCHDVTDDLDAPVPFAPGKDRYESYAEMMAHMDRVVGRLVDALDRLGLREETLIIFTTDNGTASRSIAGVRDGKLYREPVVSRRGDEEIPGGKGTLRDTGTNVPLIVNRPGHVPAGAVRDDLVDFTDFLPTHADVARFNQPPDVPYDGHSFAACLNEEGEGTRTWAFAEHRGKAFVRDRLFKLYDNGRLYDVAADPKEQQPIRPENESPAASRARARLQEALKSTGWSEPQ